MANELMPWFMRLSILLRRDSGGSPAVSGCCWIAGRGVAWAAAEEGVWLPLAWSNDIGWA